MIEFIDKAQIKKIWSLRWAIITAVLAAIPVAYVTLPDDWLPSLPGWFKALLACATLTTASITAAVRVVKQKNLENSDAGEISKDQIPANEAGQE